MADSVWKLNGMEMWEWYGYTSYEAMIEAKAGTPEDWPMPKPPPYPADDEDDIVPEPN